MKIAIIGASGFVGGALTREAGRRGHAVSAVVRDRGRAPRLDGTTVVEADLNEPGIIEALRGHDAVVASISGRREGRPQQIPDGARRLLEALPAAGVSRLVWVGGAGSLEVAPGVRSVDQADFPPAYRAEALAQAEALEIFRASDTDLGWSYFSPAAELADEPGTGSYRVEAGDRLLTDDRGFSRISIADYAKALVDELEVERFERCRFTIAALGDTR